MKHTVSTRILLILILAVGGTIAHAQVTWDGGAGTNLWSDAANWDPDGLPGNGDDVIIDGDSVVVDFDLGVTIDDIDIVNGGILNVTSGGVMNLDNSGGNQGNIEITDGTLYLTGGTLLVGDYITVDGSNSSLITTGGTLTVDGDTNPLHDILFTNGATGNIGNGSEVFVNSEFVLDNATVTISGRVENAILGVQGPYDIEMRGTSTLTIEEGAVIVMEDFDFETGGGSSEIIINGGSVTLTDDLKFNDGTDGDGVTVNGGELIVEDEIQIGSGDAEVVVNGGTVTTTGLDGNEAPYIYVTNPSVPADTIFIVTDEDVTLNFTINVFDAEGEDFLVSYGIPSKGSITEIDSTNFDYQPNDGAAGKDYVQFVVCDTTNTFVCTATILEFTIDEVNKAPYIFDTDPMVPVDTISLTTDEDVLLNFVVNVFDFEDDDFLLSYNEPTNGTFIEIDSVTIDYQPNSQIFGTEYVQFTVCDPIEIADCNSTVFEFIINPVNDAPYIYETDQGVPADTLEYETFINTSLDACVNVFDPDGDPFDLSFGSLKNDSGVLTQDTGDPKCFNYAPNSDFEGEEFFPIAVCDPTNGSLCNLTTIKISVIPFPPISSLDTLRISAPEDTPIDFCSDDFNIVGDPYTLTFEELVNNSGSIDTLSNECFQYIPNQDFNGVDYVSFTMCENDEPEVCTTTVVEFTITPVNDNPQIIFSGFETDTVFAFTDVNVPVSITIETNDVDGDSTFLLTIDPADLSIGSVSNQSGLSFDYTPDTGAQGNEFFEIIACDDTGTNSCDTAIMQIQFPKFNSAPEFQVDNEEVDTLSFKITDETVFQSCINVLNRENDPLTLTDASITSGSGTFTPDLDEQLCFDFTAGDDQNNIVSLTVCDDGDLCDDLILLIDVNHEPRLFNADTVLVDSLFLETGFNLPFTSNFDLIDIDGDSLYISSISNISGNGVLNGILDDQDERLSLSFFPVFDFTGINEFSVEICDNGDPAICKQIFVSVEVFEFNTAPAFIQNGSELDSVTFTMVENNVLEECLTVFDAEGDSAYIENFTVIAGKGDFESSVDTTFCLTYTPQLNYYGPVELSAEICDGKFDGCNTLEITIHITPTNEMPLVGTDSITATSEEGLRIDPLLNDSDPENEGLFLNTAFLITPTLGTILYEGDTILIYTPNDDEYKGVDTFTYSVCDLGVPEICVEGEIIVTLSLPIPALEIYDAFSPNGDGINDTWFIEGIREFPNNTVKVFDEWNNLVYEATRYDNRDVIWNGETNVLSSGGMLRDGTYYYSVELGNGQDALTGYVILKK